MRTLSPEEADEKEAKDITLIISRRRNNWYQLTRYLSNRAFNFKS
jgi:hypothetical protein